MRCEDGTVECDKCGSKDVGVEVCYDRYVITKEAVTKRWNVSEGEAGSEFESDSELVEAQELNGELEADGTDKETITYKLTCNSCEEVVEEGEGWPQLEAVDASESA